MMETITFTCETITPMFMAGADGTTPELRAPSIKGALRFWWRALNAHLDLENLKKKESEIFGGSGKTVLRSQILLRIAPVNNLSVDKKELVPHKPFMTQMALLPGNVFEVQLSLISTKREYKLSVDQAKALFQLTCYLGGLGKRVRRGMGSVHIIAIDGKKDDFPTTVDLGYIHKLMEKFSPFYAINAEKIFFNYNGRSPQYGYITQIELGNPDNGVLTKISKATHDVKQKHGFAYDPSMGHAFKGRYASPVYVSVIKGSLRPIITTLNLAPDKNERQASLQIQNDFKKRIL